MRKPLVSVVIPTYNRADTIIRSIESVIKQTYKNIEIIVVDDASKDNTETVLQKYIPLSNFKYIKLTNNVGGAEARNIGINKSNGKYIAFQDSDDEWMLDKLEKQMLYFNQNDVDIVFSKIKRISSEGESIFPKSNNLKPLNIATLLQVNYIGTPSAVIKKNKLEEVLGFDKTLPRLQDWDLFIRLSKNSTFHMIPEVLCNAYLQDNSITNKPQALVKTLTIFVDKYKNDIHQLTNKEQSIVYEKYGSLLVNINEIKNAKIFFKKGLKASFFNLKLVTKYLLINISIKFYKLFT